MSKQYRIVVEDVAVHLVITENGPTWADKTVAPYFFNDEELEALSEHMTINPIWIKEIENV